MKRSMVLLTAFLAVSPIALNAQTSNDSLRYFPPPERFKSVDAGWFDRRYAPTLVSPNDGVVESGIAQSVNAKVALPGGEFTEIRKSLGSLAVCGRTASIRYKAYLAGLVFDDPSILVGMEVHRLRSSEELFASLSNRLQKVLLGFNDRKYVRER